MQGSSVVLRWWLLCIALSSMLLNSCNSQPNITSPQPQTVLAVLRQFPGGALAEDRMIYNEGDVVYRIAFHTQTTTETAVAYYGPLLTPLGFKPTTSLGPTHDNHGVDFRWRHNGCPYHVVALATTDARLELTYTTGPCR